ncbi:MAG TPA: methyltransferase domain-containing protein [Fimbriiglobus sp.]|nr:methyltransferase domain-containing protein [Fimbriiglobus sp.]
MRGAVAVLTLLVPLAVQADDKKPRYETRADHDPNGIGKFYMGREIAHVMGYQAAGWLERTEREKEEEPGKLLKALGLKPGMVVADVGAGSGYHTFRMAPAVGPTGKVLAVDVQPEMIELLTARAMKEKIPNVEPVKSTPTDPKLPADGVDLALMVDVYHEVSHPYEMAEKLGAALQPGGRLVFVEFRLEDPQVPIKLVHKMSERQVIKEMGEFPELVHTKTVNTLLWQHIIIFTKKGKK